MNLHKYFGKTLARRPLSSYLDRKRFNDRMAEDIEKKIAESLTLSLSPIQKMAVQKYDDIKTISWKHNEKVKNLPYMKELRSLDEDIYHVGLFEQAAKVGSPLYSYLKVESQDFLMSFLSSGYCI